MKRSKKANKKYNKLEEFKPNPNNKISKKNKNNLNLQKPKQKYYKSQPNLKLLILDF
jgi:hypothetical protein